MDVTLLAAGGSADIAPGVLQIDWTVPGGTAADVELSVGDEGVLEPGAVHRLFAGRLLLLHVPTTVAVRVRPARDDVFADGSAVALTITVLEADEPVRQLLLPVRDVSGTRSDELVSLVPLSPARWRVTVARAAPALPDPGVRPSPAAAPNGITGSTDPAGSRRSVGSAGPAGSAVPATQAPDPVAQHDGSLGQKRGVWAARAVLPERATLTEEGKRDLVLVVDRSASMYAHVDSGALQDLLELLSGVNTVVGRQPALEVWWAEREPLRAAPRLVPAGADTWVQDWLLPRGATSGSAVTPALLALGRRTEPTCVLVITDGVPPDVTDLVAALADGPPDSGPDVGRGSLHCHLLAFARSSTDPVARLQPWQDELRSLDRAAAPSRLTWSSLAPEPEAGWLDRQLEDVQYRNALVGRLPLHGLLA